MRTYRGFSSEPARILRSGGIGVIPTDTIYGVVGSALRREAVERIYRLRERNKRKPFIVVIHSFGVLRRLGVRVPTSAFRILRKMWPAKVSVVLPCPSKKFRYLHRGTRTVAVRMPAGAALRRFLKKTGPLVAPSANVEGEPPARTVAAARGYFGDKVDFYVDGGRRAAKPSTLVKIEGGQVMVLRAGAWRARRV